MRVVTLVENLVYKKGLAAEHGLSIHIKGDSQSVVFDSGQSGLFIRNSKELGIDISEVDALVLSHGHYDHAGGISSFLSANKKARIYLKREALEPKYNGKRFVGFDASLIPPERLVYVTEMVELDNGLFIMPDIPIVNYRDTHFKHFQKGFPGNLVEDNFIDELFLAYAGQEGLSIISSCSHRGITNIVECAIKAFGLPINYIIGGFHLKDSDTEGLDLVVNYFGNHTPKHIGVSHCTGVDKYCQLRSSLNTDIFYNYTGLETIL